MSEPQQVVPLPDWQQPSPRPTPLTVIAIIGIVYASLGLLCQTFGLVSLSMVRAMPNGPVNIPESDTFTTGFQYFNMLGAIALSIPLLLASIAALYLKPIARPALLLWSVLAILFTTARMIINLVWIIPHAAMPPNMPAMWTPATMRTISMASVVGMWLVTVAFPVAMLIILTRPRVRAAFEKPTTSI